jgi:adenylate cyclase
MGKYKKHIVIITLLILGILAIIYIPEAITKWTSSNQNLGKDEITELENLNKRSTILDANLYNTYFQKGMELQNENPDSSIFFLSKSSIVAKQLNDKWKELESARQIAWCYYVKGDYPLALKSYQQVSEQASASSTTKDTEEKSLKIQAACSGNMGIVFMIQSDYAKALDYYFKALSLHEKVNYKKGQASNLGNIGLVYNEQGDYQKALKYYFKSLQLSEQIDDKMSQAYNLGNIAAVYEVKGEFKLALENYQKVIKINLALGDKSGQAIALGNVGVVYKAMGDYEKALSYFKEALQLNEVLDNKNYQAIDLNNIGDIYVKLNKFDTATLYLQKAIRFDNELHTQSGLKDDYFALHELYLATDKPAKALEAYKQHIVYRDSMERDENKEAAVQKEMQYDFDKKELAAKTAQEIKDNRQRNIRNSVIAGLIIALTFLVIVFKQRNKINEEKKHSEELLLNILPEEVAAELKLKGEAEAKLHANVSVLFTDFKGFTQLSEMVSPKDLISELNHCFVAFDKIIQKHHIEKIKTIGDAYMAVSGLPVANERHAINLVMAAIEIRDFMSGYQQQRIAENKPFFELRLGIHSGDVVAGIVGIKKFAYDVWGDTVNTASRMESSGEIGKINISESTFTLVKDHFICEYRGSIDAKGKGKMNMYFVDGYR